MAGILYHLRQIDWNAPAAENTWNTTGFSRKQQATKTQQPHKIFLGELGSSSCPGRDLPPQPLPGNSKPVALEQLQVCAEATTRTNPA